MRQTDRLAAILERLSETGGVGVSDLAQELATSPATVRRDLRLLEQQRLLSRTHGGAVAQGGEKPLLARVSWRREGARPSATDPRKAPRQQLRAAEGAPAPGDAAPVECPR